MLKKQSKQWTTQQRLRQVAWVNIFAQIAFPVAGVFTPAVAADKTHGHSQAIRPQTLQTESYQLAAGESIKSVAKRHGLTVTELKKLNQLRTFHKPFTALSAGDEIDVPKSQSGHLLAESLTQAAAAESPASHTENNTERWLASTASRAAGMLKGGNVLDSAKSQLRGMAMSEANQTVQNWLQHYGTVKLQANVDDRGRLDGSQFDMLLPLYDTEKQMAFTQFGLRHIDSRTTANFGLGQRHFFDTGMFGYNAFLDHDITRDHTRFGLGAEYARDFMKFGANGYFRASGWKDGKKLKDYEERPANGFDLRAEGYVPSYPQLGGKLIYEQYFGDEVGLLSEERRQKDPAAFTLGASYTPIPLVTLGLDRRQSTSGGGETLFNLGLNYEIGTPWSKQVDPDAVAFKRSLQGGRYDLVERNNQIVLEYRKKNLIRLMMENRINGRGGAVIPLNVNVSAQHGLKEIVWDTAGLVAGGGKLDSVNPPARTENLAAEPVRGGTRYLLTLPPFHDKGNNTYTLSGIAYDTQGNASERMETLIQVVSSAVNPGGSGFEPAEKSMVADGKTQTVIRLKLTDKDGKPVSGVAGNLKLTDDKTKLTGDGKDPELGTEVREVPEGSGIYEVTATAGTKYGKWKITPTIDGHELAPTVIDFGDSLANIIDTDRTEFKPENGNLNQEGDSTDIVLNLKDKDGNPITGAADKITLTDDKNELYGQNPAPSLGAVKEDPLGSGIYKAKVTAGKKKGTWKITPAVEGKTLKPAIITFGQSLTDIVDTGGSTFTPATNVLAANNEDSTVMTLHLKDKSGKPIPNAKDSITFEDNGDKLSGDGKNKPTIDKVWEEPENSGIYKVKVKAGDKTGQWKITTRIDGKPLDTPTEITFGSSKAELIDPDKSEFIPEKGELPNEGDTTVIKLNLKDKDGNPITGAENSINLIPDNHELYGQGQMPTTGTAKEVPPGSGTYEIPVTAGAKKGKWTLTPEVFGKPLKRPATLTFGQSLADVLDTQGSTIEPEDGSNALAADGVSTKTLRVVLKDKQGKPVTGAKDSIRVNAAGQLPGEGKDPQIGDVKEVSDGVYEVVVTAGQKTGNWTLTTTVDGTEMKKETVIEFDENKAPAVNNLQLNGILHINETLHALYQFEDKGGNTTDRSFYVWGDKGTTAKQVMALADAAGVKEPVLTQKNGEGRVTAGAADNEKVKYVIARSDVGKVLEVSILAANEANLRAKAPVTTDITDPAANRGITGGNGKGGVADPDAKPSIDKIVLSGDLEINQPLTAEYTFNGNGGDATDLSQFAWHDKGTPAADYQPVPDNGKNAQDKTGKVTRTLEQADAGKTVAITVKPVNGNNEAGEPKTVDIGMTDKGDNKTKSTGGKPGTILDPNAIPSIKNVVLHGYRSVGSTLKATYEFEPNNGYVEDKTTYIWRRVATIGGTPEDISKQGATGTVDGQGGQIESYKLSDEDINKFVEIVLTPKNGRSKPGTDISKNSSQSEGNELQGGNSKGQIIDPTRGPGIADLKIHGKLAVDEELTATYKFEDKGGHDEDNSLFLWGIKYPAGDPDYDKSPEFLVEQFNGDDKNHIVPPNNTNTIPGYRLKPEDSGRVIQVAIQARSKLGRGKSYNRDTRQEADEGNNLEGNKDGTVKGMADNFEEVWNKEGKPEVNVGGNQVVKLMAKENLLDGAKQDNIQWTIKTTNEGKPIGGVPVTISLAAENRQGKSDKVTADLEVVTNKGILKGGKGTYTGHTDQNGDLVINITDPDGKGVKTKLSATLNDGKPGKELSIQPKEVIFTVITSPDTDTANYWGHMHDTIPAGGITFHRPTLYSETRGELLPEKTDPPENGESWAYFSSSNVDNYCINTRSIKVSSLSEVKDVLLKGRKDAPIRKQYGWPTKWDYYVSTLNAGQERAAVDLENGEIRWSPNQRLSVLCRN
ncbi:inverse autotransporter beta domain-containing protein [Xenorhabdus bovienii]|uniref:inverse autotransporter beta domain-containing protein n=1 Tax=Xenorhabdus bovienii TaxID=40576 RepID=UPI0023B33DF5|nr:inverse autotransporter beta domain-containing protein [Xenorhabdus bovienii]MDE9555996.1 inverse autotransporter beta domain-containing protein [Xenorhabdus bovienii]MDE9562858.1 inverse autotransporter beta domain-containing protein [Xenorhabdus bovienii]